MQWYLAVLQKYAIFQGRARRKEVWMFLLISAIIYIVLTIVDLLIGLYDTDTGVGLLSGLYWLAVIIPTLAVGARRLHDTGRSGFWLFLYLIPVIGWIVLIVFYATDGDMDENEYGPDPKAEAQPA